MRIGIITILKVNNYGAELQAYALQAVLKKLGNDAEVIDYLFYKNRKHIKTKRSKPLFKFGLKKRMAEKLYPILTQMREHRSEAYIRREANFEKFHCQNTSLSETFATIDELYASCPDYDVYVSGSDQVWNPGIYSSVLPYLLDFAPEGKRRIAYASSFGVGSLPADARTVYQKMLSKYAAIGVRESSGVDIVRSLGLNAVNVLDPTLLLDKEDWMKVSVNPDGLPAEYILIYEITSSPYLANVAKEVASRMNIPMVRICRSASKEDNDAVNVLDAGPAEFLSLMRHAAFVVTNSFHGTAFSINFQKPFFVVTPSRKDNNSRQKNLLNLLGLSHRLLMEGDPVPTDMAIDYCDATCRLNEEREKSINFLTSAING